jgi:hypothetical protein
VDHAHDRQTLYSQMQQAKVLDKAISKNLAFEKRDALRVGRIVQSLSVLKMSRFSCVLR